MARINEVIVMVNLSSCIAEAFGTADAYLLSCVQSLDTPVEKLDSLLKSITIYQGLSKFMPKGPGYRPILVVPNARLVGSHQI